MRRLVVDASVAVKWIVPEEGTAEALALYQYRLAAPDLLTAECTNVLWKMVRRGQLSEEEAHVAAQLLGAADIELVPMRRLLVQAMRWALRLDHPAYDCFYLALAENLGIPLVSEDARLRRRLRSSRVQDISILAPAEVA